MPPIDNVKHGFVFVRTSFLSIKEWRRRRLRVQTWRSDAQVMLQFDYFRANVEILKNVQPLLSKSLDNIQSVNVADCDEIDKFRLVIQYGANGGQKKESIYFSSETKRQEWLTYIRLQTGLIQPFSDSLPPNCFYVQLLSQTEKDEQKRVFKSDDLILKLTPHSQKYIDRNKSIKEQVESLVYEWPTKLTTKCDAQTLPRHPDDTNKIIVIKFIPERLESDSQKRCTKNRGLSPGGGGGAASGSGWKEYSVTLFMDDVRETVDVMKDMEDEMHMHDLTQPESMCHKCNRQSSASLLSFNQSNERLSCVDQAVRDSDVIYSDVNYEYMNRLSRAMTNDSLLYENTSDVIASPYHQRVSITSIDSTRSARTSSQYSYNSYRSRNSSHRPSADSQDSGFIGCGVRRMTAANASNDVIVEELQPVTRRRSVTDEDTMKKWREKRANVAEMRLDTCSSEPKIHGSSSGSDNDSVLYVDVEKLKRDVAETNSAQKKGGAAYKKKPGGEERRRVSDESTGSSSASTVIQKSISRSVSSSDDDRHPNLPQLQSPVATPSLRQVAEMVETNEM